MSLILTDALPVSLSDKLLNDILKYIKYNGLILGYIAVILTVRLLGRI
jgi:hypothetical protein